jgi:hypothetical protein
VEPGVPLSLGQQTVKWSLKGAESPLHFASLEDKAILVNFDGDRLSSDDGLILLGDPDDQMGLTRDLAAVLRDSRDPRRVDFTTHDLLKQWVFQIAAGYEDANDATTLRHDPIFKLLPTVRPFFP